MTRFTIESLARTDFPSLLRDDPSSARKRLEALIADPEALASYSEAIAPRGREGAGIADEPWWDRLRRRILREGLGEGVLSPGTLARLAVDCDALAEIQFDLFSAEVPHHAWRPAFEASDEPALDEKPDDVIEATPPSTAPTPLPPPTPCPCGTTLDLDPPLAPSEASETAFGRGGICEPPPACMDLRVRPIDGGAGRRRSIRLLKIPPPAWPPPQSGICGMATVHVLAAARIAALRWADLSEFPRSLTFVDCVEMWAQFHRVERHSSPCKAVDPVFDGEGRAESPGSPPQVAGRGSSGTDFPWPRQGTRSLFMVVAATVPARFARTLRTRTQDTAWEGDPLDSIILACDRGELGGVQILGSF